MSNEPGTSRLFVLQLDEVRLVERVRIRLRHGCAELQVAVELRVEAHGERLPAHMVVTARHLAVVRRDIRVLGHRDLTDQGQNAEVRAAAFPPWVKLIVAIAVEDLAVRIARVQREHRLAAPMRRHAVACLPAIHLLVERKLVRRLQVEAADLDIDLADMALCVELQDRTGILFAAILIATTCR